MARKKQPAYGKRYSEEEKLAVVNRWQEELWQSSPRSKSAFCVDEGITAITLNAWLGAIKPGKAAERGGASEAQTVDPPVAQDVVATSAVELAVVVEDEFSRIAEQIRHYQNAADELRARLRAMVEAL